MRDSLIPFGPLSLGYSTIHSQLSPRMIFIQSMFAAQKTDVKFTSVLIFILFYSLSFLFSLIRFLIFAISTLPATD